MADIFSKTFGGGSAAVTSSTANAPTLAAGAIARGGTAPGQPLAPPELPKMPELPPLPDILANPPAAKPPAVIPTPDPTSPAMQNAAKKAALSAMSGGTRLSTILTNAAGSGKAKPPRPTGDFSKTTLGAG
jgi:hypothetical protein